MTKDATARRNQRHHMPHLQQELDMHHSNRSHYVNVCYDLAILSDFCKESHQMLLPNRNLRCSKEKSCIYKPHIRKLPSSKSVSKREWKRTTRKKPKIQVLTHGFFVRFYLNMFYCYVFKQFHCLQWPLLYPFHFIITAEIDSLYSRGRC